MSLLHVRLCAEKYQKTFDLVLYKNTAAKSTEKAVNLASTLNTIIKLFCAE